MKAEHRRGRVCPRCGAHYTDHPALSRKDNQTLICPDCGIREALEAAGSDDAQQRRILDAIHDACRQP